MAILKEMFKEEKERLLKIKKFYIDKIQELPKVYILELTGHSIWKTTDTDSGF